ncbi:protein FAM200A-like [Octopus sinensis]|uniref:Protein FAM200A-like n=1 Tax=Octopus sinensis TaxID=2607531 RepID=A0A6P7TQQ5_9MOLL|nr:protein FAM200A-like [Octopus sinensis]
MIEALAFLPIQDLEEGIEFLIDNIPKDVPDSKYIVDYFDRTYVRGYYRCLNKQENPLSLCVDNDEDFVRLLMHTEVRWLSKGDCLGRIFSLFDTVVEFFKSLNSHLGPDLESIKHDVAYLADIFAKFNVLNVQLQFADTNLIKNIGRKELNQFPRLDNLKNLLSEDDLENYVEHLITLENDMKQRFKDLCELEVPDWIIDPFQDIDDVESCCQLELIVLKNDWELKPTFKRKSYQDFWLQAVIPEKYPVLWEKAKLFFIAFPTSYLVERSFNVLSQLVAKSRNRLDVAKRGDLRLRLTNIKPNVELVSKFIQRHCSH